ncbi:MAG: pyrroline-5-carboxylate reductase [Spirochaetes bacterium GWD1_27_9]|nr:MAG: pyrroline-5-carboxylate reductase [Spirochaetes bacterium GWB1_27_13]OHD24552.1 MAG: pyrroline-5-carboxylate reductase [Spirochaetes bacterium GWC1_27_15]OHD38281.1 MAG: pyrroline-5-carboxylate reductase [Spirochaetes bacterium GWD1_27_9]
MGKLLFIGAGNMGQAIINGILQKGQYKKDEIFIYEVNLQTKNSVIENFGVKEYSKIDNSINEFDVIILAVKPQIFNNFGLDAAMSAIPQFLTKNQTIVSIMAGVSIKKMEDFFGKDSNIIRIMPNTPSLIGQGMSVISASHNVSKDKIDVVKNIFESIGLVEFIEEKHLDAVTALSGSGPAYVFMFIESLIQGGILCGLPKSFAEKLAVQTVVGSAMMVDGKKPIEELRHQVTSPAGTTIEAVSVLESKGFRSAIIEAIRAASNRSKELGKQ